MTVHGRNGPPAVPPAAGSARAARRRALSARCGHPDGAVTFYAHGDLVTIDPGYGGFTRAALTNAGEHRSMILVDGAGPKPAHKVLGGPWVAGGEDARIVAGPRTHAPGSVLVESEYCGATLARTVALVEDRWLLVEDACRSKHEKTYTTQVQLNAGAQKGRPARLAGATASWETTRRKVPACAGATADASTTAALGNGFDATGDSPEGHDFAKWSARGKAVTFLAAVAANAPGAAAPVVEALAASGGGVALRVEAGGSVDVAVSNPKRATVVVGAAAGTKRVETDGELVVVTFDAQGAGRVLARIGGTFAKVGP